MPGLLRGVARTAAIAGTATAVSGRVQRRQQGRWAAQEQQAAAQQAYAAPPPAAAAPPPAPSAAVDMETKLAQLKELGQLQQQGVLNQLEFDQQKARILAQ
ncbi:SHOCT domain-containing protein [Nocardioides sp. zg-1308]|uniref:SHOCT domain-containing protein n=1 Tax=Nocardioides sp. zg-1308 TaxID=2736253 RepID=UPI001556C357|nr:SHOCT domain-containing protein [Nocardioides sp. zg-1308]NPD06108.1 SHOCT domain-containing protein [Nocardioides sp. zg-1308]